MIFGRFIEHPALPAMVLKFAAGKSRSDNVGVKIGYKSASLQTGTFIQSYSSNL
jgi:hypothetical protein